LSENLFEQGMEPAHQIAKRKQFISLVQRYVRAGSGSGADFLKKRTWSLPVPDLTSIIRSAPFAIVGGVATRLYMPERMTLDLDILISCAHEQLVEADLHRAGAVCLGSLSIGGSQWQLGDGSALDVLSSDQPWVKEAIAHPNYAPDGSPVIALPYLVLLKLQAGRSQDMADISRMVALADPHLWQAVKLTIARYLPSASDDLESLAELGRLELDH
jgi:hypothetical protein